MGEEEKPPRDDHARNTTPSGGEPRTATRSPGGGRAAGRPITRCRPRERYPRDRRELHVAELIDVLIDIHHLTDIVREHRVYIFWREMVDARIAANMSPVSLSDGVLRVCARTSTWMHESRFLRERMIAQINRWVEAPPLLLGIRFSLDMPGRETVDHDQLPRIRRIEEGQRPKPKQPPPMLPQADQETICAETSAVEDEELRATIERVRLRWNR